MLSKNLYFLRNSDFVENILGKKLGYFLAILTFFMVAFRVGVKYSTCTWYLYLSTYLSVLAVLEYLVYGNVKVLVLVLVLDQRVLGTYK